MKHYRRLAILGALSLVLHMLVIGAIERHTLLAGAPMRDAPSTPIALRLQAPPATAIAVDSPLPAPPAHVTAAAPAIAAPVIPAQAIPAPASVRAPAPAASATPAPAPVTPVRDPQDNDVAPPAIMPGRYRVRMPASSTLDYALTRRDGTQVPAQIAWKTDGKTYAVTVDGVTGPLTSRGAMGDTGVEPGEGRMRLANGGEVAATFAPDRIDIGGTTYPNGRGSQDPASLLLQLMGMGLAEPDQVRDQVTIYVATAEGPVVMRFDVTENEDLATPMGLISTRHLRQLAGAGQAQLEVWLAPERRWLPLQLRLTAADGTITTQTITRIDDAGAK